MYDPDDDNGRHVGRALSDEAATIIAWLAVLVVGWVLATRILLALTD
jgi:hypothetical protein